MPERGLSTMRHLLLALAGLLLMGGAAAQPLRLAVSQGPVALPVRVAEALGAFEREGVAVRLLDCASGRDCMQQLSQGQADLATAAELVTTLSSLAGADAAIIATLSTSQHHIKLVASSSAGIHRPGDLRGKRIGTVLGSSAQYFLDSWLLFHNVDPRAVTVVDSAPDRLPGLLRRREVDAVAVWEPVAAAARAELDADATVLPNPRLYTQHFNLIASRPVLAQREGDLVKVLRALKRAQRAIAADPAQASRLLAKALGTPAAGMPLAEHVFHLSLDQSLIATMDAQARWAQRRGLVPAEAAAANLLRHIDPAPLRKAVPGAVSLVQ